MATMTAEEQAAMIAAQRENMRKLSSPDKFAVDPVTGQPLSSAGIAGITSGWPEKGILGGFGDWLKNAWEASSKNSQEYYDNSNKEYDKLLWGEKFANEEEAQRKVQRSLAAAAKQNTTPAQLAELDAQDADFGKSMTPPPEYTSKPSETPPEAPQSLADQLNEYKAALGGSGGQTAENPYMAQLAAAAKPQTKGQFLMALGMGMMGKPTFFEGASAGLAAAMEQGDKAKASYYDALGALAGSFESQQNRAAEVENNRQRNAISFYEAMNPAPSDKLNPLVKYSMDQRNKAWEMASKEITEGVAQGRIDIPPGEMGAAISQLAFEFLNGRPEGNRVINVMDTEE